MKPCKDCGAAIANQVVERPDCGANQNNVPVGKPKEEVRVKGSEPILVLLFEIAVRLLFVAIVVSIVSVVVYWMVGLFPAVFVGIVVGGFCSLYVFAQMYFQNQVLR